MASIQKQFKVTTKNHKDFNVVIEEYNSAFDVAEDCNTRPMTSSSFQDIRKDGDWGWNGCDSYEQALDLLRNGYVDKVEEIRKEVDKSVRRQGKRITFNNDIVGYAPIVPLAILGVPNSMINSTMKSIKTKVLEICYDMTCSCGTDSEKIINVGVEFLKVVAGLEMQGYRVKLTAVQTYTNYKNSYILKVNLKSDNQPLDLKRISFPTMHTGFFRVIGFDWYSKTPRGQYLGGYGHALTYEFTNDEELKDFKTKVFGNNVVFIAVKKLLDVKKDKLADKIKEMITNECKINNT